MVETILIINGDITQKGACAIKETLQKTEGINYVVMSLESKIAIVDYNPDVLSEKKIIAVFNTSGFDVK